MRPSPLAAVALGAGLVALLLPGVGPAEEPAFEVVQLQGEGRVVAAELADLNGDERTDVLEFAFVGYPPDESRWLRVYAQGPDGAIPTRPTHTWRLPAGSSAYDLADVQPEPGVELLLLNAEGVQVLSLGGPELTSRQLRVPSPPTFGAAEDERGIDRLRLAQPGPDGTTWLLVPQPTRAVALAPDGRVLAELDVGGRANYLVQPSPGPLLFESDIQLYLDAPRLAVGEVDGDGRPDVVAASRHYLRVFLQRPDGSLPRAPDRVLPLGRVDELDHIRGSGAVRTEVTDVDGDGRVDVLLSHASGGLTDAHTRTAIHLNRAGPPRPSDLGNAADYWDLEHADQVFETQGAWTSVQLLDLDGDGTRELVRIGIPLSILELVELLVTRAIDAELRVHRRGGTRVFEEEPWLRRKLDVPFSFETYRPQGFIPTLQSDVNGDGHRDLLASGSGEHIEVFLGGPEYRFEKRVARQKADSRGLVRFGDVDRDGLTDLLLFDPRRPDAPLRLARNARSLPGAPAPLPVISAPPPD